MTIPSLLWTLYSPTESVCTVNVASSTTQEYIPSDGLPVFLNSRTIPTPLFLVNPGTSSKLTLVPFGANQFPPELALSHLEGRLVRQRRAVSLVEPISLIIT